MILLLCLLVNLVKEEKKKTKQNNQPKIKGERLSGYVRENAKKT